MFNTHTLSRALVILVVFLFSVYLRIPNLVRPLAGHHEGITAHALTTLQNWQTKGLFAHHFSPVLSYPVPGIDYTECISGSICDPEGTVYYVSYPPFAFYAPYIIFKILFIYPDVMPIRIFNLTVGFLCALGIFAIVRLLLKKDYPHSFIPPFLAFFVYIFSPESLWFHGNVYFSEIFVQLFFILGVYLALKIIIEKKYNSSIHVFLLGLTLFFAAFTEWLGVLLGVVLLVYFVTDFKHAQKVCISIMLALFSSGALLFVAYSQVNGFSTIYNLLKNKFISRSGLIDATRSDGGLMLTPDSTNIVIGYYKKGYALIPQLVGIFAIVSLYIQKSVRHWLTRDEWLLVLFTLVPAVLHHVLFFNFTAIHDFSVLKGSVFLACAFGIFFAKAYYRTRHSKVLMYLPVLIILYLVFTSSWKGYLEENAFADVSSFKQYREGKYIANTSSPNDVVFMKDGGLDLNVFFYSKRWILSVGSKQDALRILDERKYNKGVIYYKDPETGEMSHEYLRSSGDVFEQINIMPDK